MVLAANNHCASQLNNYYTKSEVDTNIDTKDQANEFLSVKTDVVPLDDYYAKTQVDTSIYAKDQTDDIFASKVHTTELVNYYTKTDADNLLAANMDVKDMENYYTELQTPTVTPKLKPMTC